MNYPPATLLQAARLWEKTSAKGSKYMAGRLGGVKILILANRDYVENDPVNGHTHSLFCGRDDPGSEVTQWRFAVPDQVT